LSTTDLQGLNQAIRAAKTVRLFLDYDGTLADFAPNPDVILPDSRVISLLDRLAHTRKFFPAVISGRRLAHIRALLPVKGLLLAGSYGLEMLLPDGRQPLAVDTIRIRPALDRILPAWKSLLADRQGFYLEDKGLALALHARFADGREAVQVLAAARAEVERLKPGADFCLIRGERFIEILPSAASKARTVKEILENHTAPGALAVYAGDDAWDEESFTVVQRFGGLAVLVSTEEKPTRANFRIEGPAQVQNWLAGLTEL
jgi:trehalose 6-phosphate phosphatase